MFSNNNIEYLFDWKIKTARTYTVDHGNERLNRELFFRLSIHKDHVGTQYHESRYI